MDGDAPWLQLLHHIGPCFLARLGVGVGVAGCCRVAKLWAAVSQVLWLSQVLGWPPRQESLRWGPLRPWASPCYWLLLGPVVVVVVVEAKGVVVVTQLRRPRCLASRCLVPWARCSPNQAEARQTRRLPGPTCLRGRAYWPHRSHRSEPPPTQLALAAAGDAVARLGQLHHHQHQPQCCCCEPRQPLHQVHCQHPAPCWPQQHQRQRVCWCAWLQAARWLPAGSGRLTGR